MRQDKLTSQFQQALADAQSLALGLLELAGEVILSHRGLP